MTRILDGVRGGIKVQDESVLAGLARPWPGFGEAVAEPGQHRRIETPVVTASPAALPRSPAGPGASLRSMC
jgi:hypothetical protein